MDVRETYVKNNAEYVILNSFSWIHSAAGLLETNTAFITLTLFPIFKGPVLTETKFSFGIDRLIHLRRNVLYR